MDRLALGNAIEEAVHSNPRFASYIRVDNLRWVSGPRNHLHMIFEFQAMKGDQFSARWGWSIDFVPVLKGRTLRWKRTTVKADFDLCIDPIDPLGQIPTWCSYTSLNSNPQLAAVARTSFEAAASDFDSVTNLQDLVKLFDTRSRMEFRRFSLSNYVQTDLAWGLAAIAIGQGHLGQERINAFCTSFDVPRDAVALRKAIAEAEIVATEMRDP